MEEDGCSFIQWESARNSGTNNSENLNTGEDTESRDTDYSFKTEENELLSLGARTKYITEPMKTHTLAGSSFGEKVKCSVTIY